jgi:hypothetical protein
VKTSKISGISRLTRILWTLRLECGHHQSITREEMNRQQLFIGKAVECMECTQQAGKQGNHS